MKSKIGKPSKWIIVLILLLLSYFMLFHSLDIAPIQLWDESRNAINAQEMLWDGDFIVTHYGGEPDMWNTKPPFMIWNQVFWIKLLGMGELAIRLPSALAAFFTCLIILWVPFYPSYKYLGLSSFLILLSSYGFLTIHGTHTGDYDAMLTLFTSVSCIAMYFYSKTLESRWLWVFFISLALGVLTKSVSALLFLPGIAIYIIWRKQLKIILSSPQFYSALGTFLIVVLSYYLLREHRNPGYIQAVQENEWGGRFAHTIENNHDSLFSYIRNMIRDRYLPWVFILPFSYIYGHKLYKRKGEPLFIYLAILEISYLVIISISKTKLYWYDLPLYPLMALSIGGMLVEFSQKLNLKKNPINAGKAKLGHIFLATLYFTAFLYTIWALESKESKLHQMTDYSASYALQRGLRGTEDFSNTYLFEMGYLPQYQFYIDAMLKDGVKTGFTNLNSCSPGQQILVYTEDNIKSLREKFILDTLYVEGKLYSFELLKSANASD